MRKINKNMATLLMIACLVAIYPMRVNAAITPSDFIVENNSPIFVRCVNTEELNLVTGYYVTKSGETMASIAEKLEISVEDLLLANSDYRLGEEGVKAPFPELAYVEIPKEVNWSSLSNVCYYVDKGNTLWGIATYFGMDYKEIQQLNQLENADLIYAESIIRIKK